MANITRYSTRCAPREILAWRAACDALGCNFAANLKKVLAMLNFIELFLRAVAFLTCCAVAVAAALQYFDVLTK